MFIHLFNHCLTERERTYIIISHSSSCGYIVDVLIFPPGASWCVMGIQLRQSASDGQRQVVGIFHGRGRITRRRGQPCSRAHLSTSRCTFCAAQ